MRNAKHAAARPIVLPRPREPQQGLHNASYRQPPSWGPIEGDEDEFVVPAVRIPRWADLDDAVAAYREMTSAVRGNPALKRDLATPGRAPR
jgi:hypothetical protein